MNCLMAQAMTQLIHSLQNSLRKGRLKELSPFLEVVGSMAEGTRIGLANELDIHLHFKTWIKKPPFKIEEDPFSLKLARKPRDLKHHFFEEEGFQWHKFMHILLEESTDLTEQFFEEEKFQWHRFMHFLLEAVDEAIERIFEKGKNPPGLRQVTTNKDWVRGNTPCRGECKRNLEANDFEQCDQCAVTVCKTKSGVALQFEYQDHNGTGRAVYCSIDLIPFFPVEPIKNMDRVRLINEGMLSDDPPEGWLTSYLFKCAKDYKIVQFEDQADPTGNISLSKDVTSVGLKTMHFQDGRNHHIRPAQEFLESKFSSDEMKDIYRYIKFLKKALHLDLSSYWLKSELNKPEYQAILDSTTLVRCGCGEREDMALVRILSQPHFKMKLEGKIDFEESFKNGFLCRKRFARKIQH